MKRITIYVNNLNFAVRLNDESLQQAIKYVCSNLTTYKLNFNKLTKRYYKEEDGYYYVYDPIEKVYRFPITVIKEFMLALSEYRVRKEDIEIVNLGNDIELLHFNSTLNNKYILRDYQEEYRDTYIKNMSKKIMLIDSPVGSGKTLIASSIINKIGYKVGMLLLPKYIKKWIGDLKEYLNLEEDDICVIQGEDLLLSVMEDNNLDYKVYIFSIPTMTNYLRDYENGKKDYPIKPHKLMEHLGVGVLFNDESHQHFNTLARCCCYFDALTLMLSTATLDSNQKDIKRLYNTVVPPKNRISNLVQQDPYVICMVCCYNLKMSKHVKYKRAQGYNHILFEQSIMRNSIMLGDYFSMILHYFETYWYTKRKPEDKIAIFFASIDMCELFTKHMKHKYPKENIYRYIGGDDYHTMLESSIIITNHNMLGTGIDIKNLTMVIQTVSVHSLQANVQNFGRLRKIDGKDVTYLFTYTRNIPNQNRMAKSRLDVIKHKCSIVYYLEYPKDVRSW